MHSLKEFPCGKSNVHLEHGRSISLFVGLPMASCICRCWIHEAEFVGCRQFDLRLPWFLLISYRSNPSLPHIILSKFHSSFSVCDEWCEGLLPIANCQSITKVKSSLAWCYTPHLQGILIIRPIRAWPSFEHSICWLETHNVCSMMRNLDDQYCRLWDMAPYTCM